MHENYLDVFHQLFDEDVLDFDICACIWISDVETNFVNG